MTRLWLCLLATTACSGDPPLEPPASPPDRAAANAQEVTPPTRSTGVPHGQPVALIATTEQADAAFTVDSLEQARLWPALDGSREPVVVHVAPAGDVVLVHTRDGLLATVLDTVGGLELIRFDGSGVVTGRSRLPADPGFAEIDALGDRVLARRRDQVLVLLDAHGKELASLASNPGEHMRTITTRGSGAIVGLAAATDAPAPATGEPTLFDPTPAASEPAMDRVRVVDTTAGLAWGALHALRAPLTGSLAVSPSGQRIAGLLAEDGQPVIATPSAGELTPIASSPVRFPAGTFLGFLDEETLLVSSGSLARWRLPQPISQDPWVTPNLDVQGNENTLAIANGLVVGARGTGLQLVDAKRSRYLGYRQLVNNSTVVFGAVGAVAAAERVTWFDRDLREIATRTSPLTSSGRDQYVIGPQHVVQIERLGAPNDVASVYLQGAPTQPPILLGTWSEVGTPTFHPGTRVLAIPTVKGEAGGRRTHIERFEIDLATHTTRRLAPLTSDKVLLSRVKLLDPDEAHGLVAAGVGWATQLAVVRFMEADASGNPIQGKLDFIEGTDIDLGIDRSGTAFFLRPSTEEIVSVPASGTRSTQALGPIGELLRRTGEVSPDGKQFIFMGSGMVVAVGRDGVERWRRPSDAQHASFRDDGTIVLDSGNGMVAVDAATGTRVARACAYGFELSTRTPNIESFQGENACTVDE